MSKFLTKNFDFRGHLSTCSAENTPKSGPFKYKNNAQTLLKQLQNNFEEVQKSTFLTPKIVKNDPIKSEKMSKIWTEISIFEVYYRPFELKINT